MIRSRVLGMPAGTLLSGATEVAISTAAGIVAERFVGERLAQTIIDAGFASVIRATVKQLKTPWVAEALADDTRRQNFVIRGGRAFPAVNGYVAGRMNGYVGGRGNVIPLGGYVGGRGNVDNAVAASMANRS
jgi:hypothetical protein